MTSHQSWVATKKVEELIHPEHQETDSIIEHAKKGGVIAGLIAFTVVLGIFFFMHFTDISSDLDLTVYVTWAIASMTLVFASAIIGMLIGILFSETQSKIRFLQHHHEAVSDALLEINIREAIRNIIPSSRRM